MGEPTKKLSLNFDADNFKQKLGVAFNLADGGWKVDNTLSVVKHTGSGTLGFVAGLAVSYVW